MSISPWDSFAQQESPDGRYVAVFDDAMEIAMGAPTRGTLTVRDRGDERPIVKIPDASGSFVWSSDSSAIAFPRWSIKRDQTLCICGMPGGQITEVRGRFRVLQLESFHDNRLIGVDSPIHQPSKVAILIPQTTGNQGAGVLGKIIRWLILIVPMPFLNPVLLSGRLDIGSSIFFATLLALSWAILAAVLMAGRVGVWFLFLIEILVLFFSLQVSFSMIPEGVPVYIYSGQSMHSYIIHGAEATLILLVTIVAAMTVPRFHGGLD
jgi:hypothetical protein